MMIEFEDHSDENQKALLEYLDREEQASSSPYVPVLRRDQSVSVGHEDGGIHLPEMRAGCWRSAGVW